MLTVLGSTWSALPRIRRQKAEFRRFPCIRRGLELREGVDSPDDPKPKGKRFQRLLDTKQHAECRRMYLSAMMRPKDISRCLNEQFGLNLTPLQVSEYARSRGWTKRKKRDTEKAVILAESRKAVAAKSKEIVSQHQDFLDASARVGAKIVKKAEIFVDRAPDAKSLSSAANAARTGVEIYRKAVGLESNEPTSFVNKGIINVAFATSDESPFAKAKLEQVIDVTPESEEEPDEAPEAGE